MDRKKAKAERVARREETRTVYSSFLARATDAGVIRCNICGGTRFRDFKSRLLARCAKCRSLERARFLRFRLDGLVQPGMRVLHIAPDHGISGWIESVVGDGYVCADIDAERYVGRTNFHQLDLCKPFPDFGAPFDLILHSHVLEHVPCNFTSVLARLNALLKSDGCQVMILPLYDGHYEESLAPMEDDAARIVRRQRMGQVNHVRKFGKADLEQTIGPLLPFGEYRNFDMRAFATEAQLTQANIPDFMWEGVNNCTPFVLRKSEFLTGVPDGCRACQDALDS